MRGMKKGKAALYLRVSTDEQVERQSVETQTDFLREFCRLFEIEIVAVYRDEGISGTIPLHQRPEGARMLASAHGDETAGFDTVLVYKLDRLGRSLMVVVDAHDRLEALGISLRSATESIETTTPSGRLIFQMLASFAEFERGTIRERTQAGLHRALRSGKMPGRIPYGYDIGEDGLMALVPEEAEVVREIIENIASGSTLYREAKRLNDSGLPAPGMRYRGRERKHGEKWSPTTIHNIIHQNAYGGLHRAKLYDGKEHVDREVPAIVPPDTQEAARQSLSKNKARYNRATDRKYLLSGLVKCEVCGSACVGHPTTSKGKKFYYYICADDRPGKREKAPAGHAPYVRAEKLEDAVWQDVRKFLSNPGAALGKLQQRQGGAGKERELKKRRKGLEKRLAAKEAERDRYIRLYGTGRISEADLDSYVLETESTAENLRGLIETLDSEMSRRREDENLRTSTAAWLSVLSERISEVEEDTEEAFGARKEIVNLLVEGVYIGERKKKGKPDIRVVYRFGVPERPANGRLSGDDEGISFVDRFLNSCELSTGSTNEARIERVLELV